MGVVMVVVRAANGRGVNKGAREGCGSKMDGLPSVSLRYKLWQKMSCSCYETVRSRCQKSVAATKGELSLFSKRKNWGEGSVGVSCPLLLAGGKEVWWLMLPRRALIVSCFSANCRSQGSIPGTVA